MSNEIIANIQAFEAKFFLVQDIKKQKLTNPN